MREPPVDHLFRRRLQQQIEIGSAKDQGRAFDLIPQGPKLPRVSPRRPKPPSDHAVKAKAIAANRHGLAGARQLTQIFMGASSTAIDFDRIFTAPLVALYQVRPGRGRTPAVEPILMIDPPLCRCMIGTTRFVIR